jgi:hypothetical protein
MKTIATAMAIAGSFIISAHGQGYLNLSFEAAQNLPGNPPIPDGVDVPATNALPDWTAYGGNALGSINYVSNYISGASTLVVLEGGSLALSGSFSVGLFPGGSISQTGLVPTDAESLEFEAEGPGQGGSLGGTGFVVALGGQSLSYSLISQGPDYIVYGANIPAGMDGQMEVLTFGVGIAQAEVDNIEFSTTGVPEPAEWALIGIGVVLFGFWRRRLTAKNA